MSFNPGDAAEPTIDWYQVIGNLLTIATNPHNDHVQMKRATENLKRFMDDERVVQFFADIKEQERRVKFTQRALALKNKFKSGKT
jgi:hypothetical protein